MKIDFRRIEYFLKIAQCQNINSAAKQLYISPQALSQYLNSLENELGVTLFDRTHNGIHLTKIGQICEKEFLHLEAEYNKSMEKILSFISSRSPYIKIGFQDTIPKDYVIQPLLNTLTSFISPYKINLITYNFDGLFQMMNEQRVDLCIINIPKYKMSNKYLYKHLYEIPSKILVSTKHPFSHQKRITSNDLLKGKIAIMPGTFLPEAVETNISSYQITHVTNLKSLLALIELGEYYTISPDLLKFSDSPSLKKIQLPTNFYQTYYLSFVVPNNSDGRKVFSLVEKFPEFIPIHEENIND